LIKQADKSGQFYCFREAIRCFLQNLIDIINLNWNESYYLIAA